MSRSRRRRKTEKAKRHAPSAPKPSGFAGTVVRYATHVERLAYTRTQAADALGVSRSTFNRRILPFIDTVEMGWGTRLVPVDELERFVAERRQKAQAKPRPHARSGRKEGLPPEVVTRISDEHKAGESLGEIARGLNADGVKTSQGGRRWWASTVRVVLARTGAQ